MVNFIDKTSTVAGTPLSRKNLMAVQGMEDFTCKRSNGETVITFKDGSILTYSNVTTSGYTETYSAENKTITQTVTVSKTISGVLS